MLNITEVNRSCELTKSFLAIVLLLGSGNIYIQFNRTSATLLSLLSISLALALIGLFCSIGSRILILSIFIIDLFSFRAIVSLSTKINLFPVLDNSRAWNYSFKFLFWIFRIHYNNISNIILDLFIINSIRELSFTLFS